MFISIFTFRCISRQTSPLETERKSGRCREVALSYCVTVPHVSAFSVRAYCSIELPKIMEIYQ